MRSYLWFNFFFNNWYQSHHGWHLSCIFFGLFRVSVFLLGSQFWGFFCLVLILRFEAKLMLETCRKHLLKESPSFFLGFWNLIDGISKIGVSYSYSFMLFCAIFGQDWWINVRGWKTVCLSWKSHNFWLNFFFSSRFVQPEPSLFSLWKRQWCHQIFFFWLSFVLPFLDW